MGVIQHSQTCTVAECWLRNGLYIFHFPFTQKGDSSVQAKSAPAERQEDQNLSGCCIDVASWIWGSGWPKGTMLEIIHRRVRLLFFFHDSPSPKYNCENTGLYYFLDLNRPLSISLHLFAAIRDDKLWNCGGMPKNSPYFVLSDFEASLNIHASFGLCLSFTQHTNTS